MVTYIIIGINILLFAAESMKGGAMNQEVALKFGAQYTPYIQQGQWYRLFTSMFLHFGFLHLICNMYSLYNLGPSLEYIFGIPIFVVLYLASGLAANYSSGNVSSALTGILLLIVVASAYGIFHFVFSSLHLYPSPPPVQRRTAAWVPPQRAAAKSAAANCFLFIGISFSCQGRI